MDKRIKTYLAYGLMAALCLPTAAMAENTPPSQLAVSQQAKVVKGTVVDENGEPLIGVTVKVAGASGGSITDIDGNFTISNAEGKNLQFSYTGYKTVTLKASRDMQVKMEPDMQGLDEVVVIGFGTVKKRDLTGSVASVKSETLVQAPTSSAVTALQGRVTGLDVYTDEDGDLQMRIRGNRSLNGSNSPLVIIDGVQGGSISDLNPDDIESIDVLKDASSTAIYGSQGANGVIIVTTKKAEAGRMEISYNGYVTAGFRQQHPDYREGTNWYEARRIAAANAGQWSSPADDANLFPSLAAFAAYRAGSWTDYDDELQKSTTWSHRHTVTLSGGNDRTQARFSIGYANDGNKWKKSSGTDRYTLRANIDHKLYKWIDAGVKFQLTHNRSEASPYQNTPTTGMQLGNPYGVYDATANTYTNGPELVTYPLSATDYVNPLINTKGETDLYSQERYGTNVVANGYLDIHPIDGLSFRTQFNAHITNSTIGSYEDANSARVLSAGTQQSTAQMQKSSGLYIEWNNILTYQFKMLPEDHHLSLTALTTWNKKTTDNLWAQSINQISPSNLWWNLQSNDGKDGHQTHTSSYTKQQNFSYAFRVNYDWKSRYLFTASLRRDGASVLAAGSKWDTFPSVAVAWRASDEPFIKEFTKSWLDDLKIRLTYGVTGNAGIPVYGSSTGITFANWSFGFQDTAANRYIPGKLDSSTGKYLVKNSGIGWEKSKTFDVGFDMMLFNNRLNITFDYYNTKTTDLILLRSLPTTAGNDGNFATYSNIGATRNHGVEVTINSRNIVTKDFTWNSTLSFSANKEEVTELYGGLDKLQLDTNKENSTLMVGRPLWSYTTYKYLGIWSTAEAAEAATYTDAYKNKPFEPGEFKLEDINGDRIIDDKDQGYIGSKSPDWFLGFNNDLRYKNWDLNIYIYARWGHWGENPLASFDPANGGKYTNMDYWVAGTNEGGSFPALKAGTQYFNYTGYQSTWYVEQSFIKLKRVSLGYTLPKALVKKASMQSVRVYCTVNNPLYIVKEDWMKHWDPEGQQRSVTLGVNVNF